jgi:NAD+ synthase (glutamine-hydrolysing)
MPVRVATASVNQTPLDWRGNRNRILEATRAIMDQASAHEGGRRPDVILFPELCVSGYGCEDAFHMPELWNQARQSLESLSKELGRIAGSTPVVVGLPWNHLGFLYNVAAVIQSGQIVALIPKQHLAGDGIHYEPRWFQPYRGGPDQSEGIPFGPILIDTGVFRFIIEICEDSWVENRPASQHAGSGFDAILSPTASHFAIGKLRIRRQIALESSRLFHCLYTAVNLLGNEAGRAIYDGQTIACQSGSRLYESAAFSFRPYNVHFIDFELSPQRSSRSQCHSFRDSVAVPTHSSLEAATVNLETDGSPGFGFRLPGDANPEAAAIASEESPGLLKRHGHPFNEFLYATTLGLFDYMRKSRSRGYALSLSGGADSGACAVLVERMVRFGVSELGAAGFLQAIGRSDLESVLTDIPREEATQEDSRSQEQHHGIGFRQPVTPARVSRPRDDAAVRALTGQLLHTIYQATDQSSETTAGAAQKIATTLGANHQKVEIQSIVNQYIDRYQRTYDLELNWKENDIVLQNIQARARSPFVWMLANATGSLLIATGNRSEGAVGYCTMDGDTSGGIAPIAGIDKDFLRAWLKHMEVTGDEFGPLPALRAINDQQPTAELRPEEQHQTDEDDLMPYDLLNRIQKLAVRDRLGPAGILKQLQKDNGLPTRSAADEPGKHFETAGSVPHEGEHQAFRPFQGSFQRSEFIEAIRKYFKLWSRSQWKRERIAVSFHLDEENIDPRSYFRFPILSAGFEEELESME